jgi:hypothetical protein
LFINTGSRNPDVGRPGDPPSTRTMADVRFNIVWQWGELGVGTRVRDGAWANVTDNVYSNPGQSLSDQNSHIARSGTVSLYTAGNISLDPGTKDPNTRGNVSTPHTVPYDMVPTPACQAASDVLAHTGAQPRDATDNALIAQVSLSNCP